MQNQTVIYNFLINPRFRVWRHIVLITTVVLIVLNQLSAVFNFQIVFVNQLFIYIIPVTISYLIVIYFNLYFLIPKYLLAKKYFRFIVGLIVSVLILNIVMDINEYIIYKVMDTPFNHLSVFHGNNFFSNMAFNIFQLTICIMGIGTIVILKEWMKENKSILQLEREILQSEVEQLKERIAPETLFRILNNTAKKAKDNSEEASIILVKLSHVLRYQLYDCSRDKVQLNAEISFIENYLILLQMNFGKPSYKISIEGNTDMIFVPPLLFSSILQVIIDKIESNTILNINFKVNKEQILFLCVGDSIVFDGLAKIEQRLKFLYGEEYSIILKENRIELKIRI